MNPAPRECMDCGRILIDMARDLEMRRKDLRGVGGAG